MIIRASGQHELGYRPIGGQYLLLVTAEIVERRRGAAHVPQLGDGVVGSGEEEVLVAGRPGNRGNPTSVMRQRGFDDGSLL